MKRRVDLSALLIIFLVVDAHNQICEANIFLKVRRQLPLLILYDMLILDFKTGKGN